MGFSLRAAVQRRWSRWLSRRIPRQREYTLNQRRIFIFLNRQGFVVAMVLLALFAGGLNYANNLLLGLCFLLSSLMIVTIHHTYANLSGLKVSAGHTEPAFAGSKAGFYLRLERSGKRAYESLDLAWGDAVQHVARVQEAVDVGFFITAPERGRFQPPRLKIETVFPLGLLRAWTWLDLETQVLVYPRPLESRERPSGAGSDSDGEVQRRTGPEDFDGFRRYAPGDSLAHVSWAHLARGQGLLTKQYITEVAGTDMLDWDFFPGLDTELRLSRLCWWVEHLSREERSFGLRLPGLSIPVGHGPQHREACLEALALHEWRPRDGR